MLHVRTITGCAILAAIVSLFTSSPAMADHLDRWETRQLVRHLEEHNDALQDHIYSWVSERRDERERRASDMLHASDHFDQTLAQFKVDLYSHDEPWDLRDNAQGVIDAARDVGRAVDRDEWHDEFRHEWEGVRDLANDLAHHYHLHTIE
jgi:predicted RNA-binding protein with EMAP domain